MKRKESGNSSFGLRTVLHSESDFTICWSSRHTSQCESLMKRQTCFRFHQKAQHALWCLWWSGTTLHFERNLWSPGARCISCVSSGMDGSARSPTPRLGPISATFLPVTNQTFAHQGVLTLSILVESGRLTGHQGDYKKDVWWASLAAPQIDQISSDAEPKASVWRLCAPEKCCKACLHLLRQWVACPHLMGRNVILAGWQSLKTKENAK